VEVLTYDGVDPRKLSVESRLHISNEHTSILIERCITRGSSTCNPRRLLSRGRFSVSAEYRISVCYKMCRDPGLYRDGFAYVQTVVASGFPRHTRTLFFNCIGTIHSILGNTYVVMSGSDSLYMNEHDMPARPSRSQDHYELVIELTQG
jgi:hypothetical protein